MSELSRIVGRPAGVGELVRVGSAGLYSRKNKGSLSLYNHRGKWYLSLDFREEKDSKSFS